MSRRPTGPRRRRRARRRPRHDEHELVMSGRVTGGCWVGVCWYEAGGGGTLRSAAVLRGGGSGSATSPPRERTRNTGVAIETTFGCPASSPLSILRELKSA
jgi:hypothetical protein